MTQLCQPRDGVSGGPETKELGGSCVTKVKVTFVWAATLLSLQPAPSPSLLPRPHNCSWSWGAIVLARETSLRTLGHGGSRGGIYELWG